MTLRWNKLFSALHKEKSPCVFRFLLRNNIYGGKRYENDQGLESERTIEWTDASFNRKCFVHAHYSKVRLHDTVNEFYTLIGASGIQIIL